MAITKKARKDLLVRIEPQPGQEQGTLLPNGLIKTSMGLVIPPSTIGGSGDTKSGALAELSEQEKQLARISDQYSAVQVDAPESMRRKRRKQPAPQEAAPEAAPVVSARIVLEGLGEVPSQYTHIYKGVGVCVLGMNQYSYTPPKAVRTSSGFSGVFSFAGTPYTRYVYSGFEFRDDAGTRNIVLLQLPDKPEQESVPDKSADELEQEFEEELDGNV